MILGTILATLVITIGVATGNISSNNTKYGNALLTSEHTHKETKPKKLVDFNETLNFTQVSTYEEDRQEDVGKWATYNNYKYFLDGNITTNSSFGTLYNSTYVTEKWYNQHKNQNLTVNAYTHIMCFIDITPYLSSYGTDANFQIKYIITGTGQVANDFTIGTQAYLLPLNLRNEIGLTLYNTDDIYNRISTELTTENRLYNWTDHTTQPYNTNIYYDKTITIGNIEEEKLLLIRMKILVGQISTQSDTRITTVPQDLEISGEQQPINYEVIDLPGLMFEILTMPFSFISTAFNLTVFPGTPYAFNFGNVFLTIIAAFILLWLLKKVF